MTEGRKTIESLLGIADRTSRTAAAAALGVLLAHWAFVFAFVWPRLGTLEFLRLHHTATLGVDWVGRWWLIFIFPLVGFAAFFVNGALSGILVARAKRLPPVIYATTAGLECLLAAAGAMAVLLNG